MFGYIDVINMGGVPNISVFLWGDHEFLKEDQEYKDKYSQLNIIKFDEFYSNLTK